MARDVGGEKKRRAAPPKRRFRRATKAKLAMVKRLWAAQLSLRDIAERVGVSWATVNRWVGQLRKAGEDLPARPRGWRSPKRVARYERLEPRNAQIVAMLKVPAGQRPSYQAVADQFGVSRGAVSSLMRRYRAQGVVAPIVARWSAEEDSYLKAHAGAGSRAVATGLGRSIESVQRRASQTGVKLGPHDGKTNP